MRDYFSETNLLKAMPLGAAAALMSVPRILQLESANGLLISACLVGMILVAGAATAWSRHAGMHGLFPSRQEALRGCAVGFALGALLAFPSHFWVDPVARRAILGAGGNALLDLRMPGRPSDVVALMLWSAGFETLFFTAAAMSFGGRITHNQWAAVVLVVLLRVTTTLRQLDVLGIPEAHGLFMTASAVFSGISGLLFARWGLAAPMAFSAALNIRLFY